MSRGVERFGDLAIRASPVLFIVLAHLGTNLTWPTDAECEVRALRRGVHVRQWAANPSSLLTFMFTHFSSAHLMSNCIAMGACLNEAVLLTSALSSRATECVVRSSPHRSMLTSSNVNHNHSSVTKPVSLANSLADTVRLCIIFVFGSYAGLACQCWHVHLRECHKHALCRAAMRVISLPTWASYEQFTRGVMSSYSHTVGYLLRGSVTVYASLRVLFTRIWSLADGSTCTDDVTMQRTFDCFYSRAHFGSCGSLSDMLDCVASALSRMSDTCEKALGVVARTMHIYTSELASLLPLPCLPSGSPFFSSWSSVYATCIIPSADVIAVGASAGIFAMSGFNAAYSRTSTVMLSLICSEFAEMVRKQAMTASPSSSTWLEWDRSCISNWLRTERGVQTGHAGHLGGLAVGLTLGYLWRRAEMYWKHWRTNVHSTVSD